MSVSVNHHQLQTTTTTSFAPTPEFCAQVDDLHSLVGKLKTSIDSPQCTLSKSEVRQLVDTIQAIATVTLSDLDRFIVAESQLTTTKTAATTSSTSDGGHRRSNPNQHVFRCNRRQCRFFTTSPTVFGRHRLTHTKERQDQTDHQADDDDEDDDDAEVGHEDQPSCSKSDNVELSASESNHGPAARVENIQRTPKRRKEGNERPIRGCGGGQGGGAAGGNGSGSGLPPRIQDDAVLEPELELANRNHDDGDQVIPELALARDVAQQPPPQNDQIHDQNREDDQNVVDRIDPDDADDGDLEAFARIHRNADDDGNQEVLDRMDPNAAADDDDDDQEVVDQIDPNAAADDDDDDQEVVDQIDPNAAAQPEIPPNDQNLNQLRRSTRKCTQVIRFKSYEDDKIEKMWQKEMKKLKQSESEKRFELNRDNPDTPNLALIQDVIVANDPRIQEHLQLNQNQQVAKIIVVCQAN